MAVNLDTQILAHRFDVLQRNTPFIVLGSVLVAAAVAWVLHASLPARVLWVWSGLIGLHALLRMGFWARLQRRQPQGREVLPATRVHVGLSLASGLLWGGGAVWLFQAPRLEDHLVITFMLAGMVTSSLHSQTAHLPAFHAFFIPCALAGVGGNLLVGGPVHQAVALSVLAYCVLALRFARTLNHNFTEAWRARFEIADLAQRLQQQKEAAEEANLAKSRFLAAASHDLRQPVHALSLFIGALRARPLDAHAQTVVAHADQAVQSMAAMFSALLDMSRLDARVVQPEMGPVPLRPLLDKLLAEHRTQAEAKGLRLRCHAPAALWVWSDAVMLERILRNLLVNAIRYTARGGVLLGCRRRGAVLRLEVWDTGCGIPAQRQPELFQEFVQLQPAGAGRQGLGLGLAIVKRLAALLGHPVRLASREGRGSVFGVQLALASPPAQQQLPPPADAVATPSPGQGDWVLVLDDDDGIRGAMVLLLEQQGFQVLAAPDLAQLQAGLVSLPRCPALIITDHGLGAGADGTQAVEQLRDEFNAAIPAIVVTGNTSPELLRALSAAGLPLLHKPVSPEALMAMVGSLLRSARASADGGRVGGDEQA